MLFRALCCLCSNRQSASGSGYYSQQDRCYESSDDEDYDELDEFRARALKLSKLKRNAINVTADVIAADKLLRRHGNDSSLLMYYDRCSEEMTRALNKLPLASHGAQIEGLRSSQARARDTLV